MWILWVIGFVILFFIIAQMISRLPGENYAGLKKVIPTERPEVGDGVITENTIERITGGSQPFFENLLVLEVTSPNQLLASWKLDPKLYAIKLTDYHQENVDMEKAVIRLSYSGGKRIYEDFPIRLKEHETDLIVNGPGCTINAELGFYTEDHNFISLATSNDVILPK